MNYILGCKTRQRSSNYPGLAKKAKLPSLFYRSSSSHDEIFTAQSLKRTCGKAGLAKIRCSNPFAHPVQKVGEMNKEEEEEEDLKALLQLPILTFCTAAAGRATRELLPVFPRWAAAAALFQPAWMKMAGVFFRRPGRRHFLRILLVQKMAKNTATTTPLLPVSPDHKKENRYYGMVATTFCCCHRNIIAR